MRWERVAAIAVLASASAADGAGYYNMPTSLQQCLGVGFGPGHHAPLLLGPMGKSGITAQAVVRLDSPLPPPACDFCGPSLWGGDAASSFTGAPYGSYPAAPRGYAAPAPAFAEPYPSAAVSAPMLTAPRVTETPKGAEAIPAPKPAAD